MEKKIVDECEWEWMDWMKDEESNSSNSSTESPERKKPQYHLQFYECVQCSYIYNYRMASMVTICIIEWIKTFHHFHMMNIIKIKSVERKQSNLLWIVCAFVLLLVCYYCRNMVLLNLPKWLLLDEEVYKCDSTEIVYRNATGSSNGSSCI